MTISLAILHLIAQALEINTSAWVFSGGEIGGSHEALAVRPGSFRRYRLHRIPSVGSVCFSKRSVNQNKRSSKRLSCFYLAPYRNPPGPSDLGWRSSGATVCVCSGHGVGWAIAPAGWRCWPQSAAPHLTCPGRSSGSMFGDRSAPRL